MKSIISLLTMGSLLLFAAANIAIGAERVISLYILSGDKQGLKDFMTEHHDALAKAHSLVASYLSDGVDGFIANSNIESLFKRKGDWLESLKQYSL
ncbi:hypothetical protein [Acetonema longum]|uniref:Uncharacterized protein n=1 Tax=Acetonema longum DSM 6540 TaxID=1009370 RepID=F7NDY6_9FIRM|nr:hypothetical protein [Acetonema longum]EGO65740.1 hypothetical protein ALO_01240 [Acetonema longum DSM 6540]